MSFSLLVVCMLRLDDGRVVRAVGQEVKELGQDMSLVVFDAYGPKRMNMNSCLYADGSKVEAVYLQQIAPAIHKLNK